jgi:hypothetical protein
MNQKEQQSNVKFKRTSGLLTPAFDAKFHTQAELAIAVGKIMGLNEPACSQHMAGIVQGKRTAPPKTLEPLCIALGVPYQLVYDTMEEEKTQIKRIKDGVEPLKPKQRKKAI